LLDSRIAAEQIFAESIDRGVKTSALQCMHCRIEPQ
jgi:hypothetical protein